MHVPLSSVANGLKIHSRLVCTTWNLLFVTNPIAVRIIQTVAFAIKERHRWVPKCTDTAEAGLCIKIAHAVSSVHPTHEEKSHKLTMM